MRLTYPRLRIYLFLRFLECHRLSAMHRIGCWSRLVSVDSLAFALIAEISNVECIKDCGVALISIRVFKLLLFRVITILEVLGLCDHA